MPVTPSQSDTQELTVTIDPEPGPPLTIATTSLPDGTVGQPYSETLTATGGTPPYTWSLDTGSLPAGLDAECGDRSDHGDSDEPRAHLRSRRRWRTARPRATCRSCRSRSRPRRPRRSRRRRFPEARSASRTPRRCRRPAARRATRGRSTRGRSRQVCAHRLVRGRQRHADERRRLFVHGQGDGQRVADRHPGPLDQRSPARHR